MDGRQGRKIPSLRLGIGRAIRPPPPPPPPRTRAGCASNLQTSRHSRARLALFSHRYTGAVLPLQASTAVAAGYEGHAYALVSPVLQGWAFLGEVDKYVPASRKRFPSVVPNGQGLVVQVAGVAEETVRVCAARASARTGTWKLFCAEVAFVTGGVSTVVLP